jgi:hypothetical protein
LSNTASISVSDLSGFASLREAPAIQGRPASARGYSEKVREQAAAGSNQMGKWKAKRPEVPHLSKTASILNLSGFASLRDASAIQGREGFFTQRRQGAKGEGRQSAKKGPIFARGYSEGVREQRGLAGGGSKKGPAAGDQTSARGSGSASGGSYQEER